MKLKEIDVLEIGKHDLIECMTNYQGLGYYLKIEPKRRILREHLEESLNQLFIKSLY